MGFLSITKQFDTLDDGLYKIVISSTLTDGKMNCELLIKGKSDKEIFLSTYLPSWLIMNYLVQQLLLFWQNGYKWLTN